MQTDVLHKGTAFPVGAPREKRRFEWGWIVIALCVIVTIYLAVIPLGFLLWQSFFTPQTAAKAAEFTTGNYAEAYGSPETYRLFTNSVKFAIGTSLFSFLLGTLINVTSLFLAIPLIFIYFGGLLGSEAFARQRRIMQMKRFRRDARTKKVEFDEEDKKTIYV